MAKKAKQEPGGDFVVGVNLAEVERLLTFMENHRLEEFEYQQGNVHIRLKKGAAGTSAVDASGPASTHGGGGYTGSGPVMMPAHPSAAASVAHAHAHTIPAPPVEDLHVVKSPIVGTYYASPSPDAEPFVTVGSRVEAGQVLCIIEAMKLMNEIESDVTGEVARVLIENGHPVEYGEPLFGIRVTGRK
jgi:acetyl-CoA carboxylase biotin carboxyl carrier protein